MKVSTPVPDNNHIANSLQTGLSGQDLVDKASKRRIAFDNRKLKEILSRNENGKRLDDEGYRKLKEELEKNSDLLKFLNGRLKFSVHKETSRIQVSILDGATDEVIKKIPPDELLDILTHLREMKGILIDEKQ